MNNPLDFARYRLKPLCAGGTAHVFRAIPRNGHAPVLAIKILKHSLVDAVEVRERFLAESECLADLCHPGVVELQACGIFAGRPYVATRYIGGTPANKVLQETAKVAGPGWTFACRTLHSLLCILAYLHSHRTPLVHGDISPENVLLDRDGKAHLIDFGCAQYLRAEGDTAGKWIGKPSYLSPEQARGLGWDRRSDLYQAGILFYELLSGRKLNPGRDARQARILAAQPPPLKLAEIPAFLHPFLRRILATEADHRRDSAQQYLAELDRLAEFAQPSPATASAPA